MSSRRDRRSEKGLQAARSTARARTQSYHEVLTWGSVPRVTVHEMEHVSFLGLLSQTTAKRAAGKCPGNEFSHSPGGQDPNSWHQRALALPEGGGDSPRLPPAASGRSGCSSACGCIALVSASAFLPTSSPRSFLLQRRLSLGLGPTWITRGDLKILKLNYICKGSFFK